LVHVFIRRAKRARRVAKEVERKKEAMQKFAENVMARYKFKKIRSLKIWECSREVRQHDCCPA
jgi:5-formyltetrahydrofolate cyclo-ligase